MEPNLKGCSENKIVRMVPNLKRCKTRHHHQSTKNTIHDLPQEILCDILSRLPAESLISNKVVSKFWYSLISDTKFVDAHLIRSRLQWEYQQTLVYKQYSKGLLGKREHELIHFTQPKCQVSKLEDYEFLGFEQAKKLLFLSSCNGLLLFRHFFDNNQFCVFNPVTRKYRDLPILEIDEDDYIEDYALIYDASVQKYKVVAISAFMQKCYVYTLDSNKGKAKQVASVVHWKELVMPYKDSYLFAYSIIVNNKLHWLALLDDDACKEIILMYTLDISKEEFKETKIPFLTLDASKNILIELMGSLCIIDFPCNLKQMDIWTLQDGAEGQWTKRSIRYEFELNLRHYFVCSSVCQTRILVTQKTKIFIYDLENKDWKTIVLPVQEHSPVLFVSTNSLVKWS